MSRLPIPGSDDGKWGQILNEYLSRSHDETGALKAGTVGSSQIINGSITSDKLAPDTINKTDIGLGNVDNTADSDKPVSDATQTALNAKLALSALDSETAAKINNSNSETSAAVSTAAQSIAFASQETARRYSEGIVGRSGTPSACYAHRTSAVTIPLNTESTIAYTTEGYDTDGWHSNSTNNTRFTNPFNIPIFVELSAIARSGTNTHGMKSSIRINGGTYLERRFENPPYDPGETSVCEAKLITILEPGHYVEHLVKNFNTSATMSVTPEFRVRVLGEVIGTYVGPYGSERRFSPDYKIKGLGRYTNVRNSHRATIVDDPELGAQRQVLKLNLHEGDTFAGYDRVQCETSSSWAEGDTIWTTLGVYLPDDFPLVNSTLGEIYGPPSNGFGPGVFARIDDGQWAFRAGEDAAIWTAPINTGTWHYMVYGTRLQKTATGWSELWIWDGTTWVQQMLGGVSCYQHATMKAGINDSGNQYLSAPKLTSLEEGYSQATAYFVGGEIWSSRPNTSPLNWGMALST